MMKYLLVLIVAVCAVYASLKDEMDALEAELAKNNQKADADTRKKSIEDLSVDELIDELKKEMKKKEIVKKAIPGCTAHRAAANKQALGSFGAYIPQCNPKTGQYQNIQCHPSTGYCWCVDSKSGKEIPGTRKGLRQGIVDCSDHNDAFRSKFHNIVNKKDYSKDSLKLRKRVTPVTACRDVRSDCAELKNMGMCTTHMEKLKEQCKQTCDYCDKCVDHNSQCPMWEKLNMCENRRDEIAHLCPKSCGYCKAPAPPKCSKSTYGCCWDKETVRYYKDGRNCPECKDHYPYVCETFKPDCGHMGLAGEFMRMFCPQKCNLCSSVCQDAPDKAFYCKLWKKDLNWCDLPNRKETMRHYCPVTCGFC